MGKHERQSRMMMQGTTGVQSMAQMATPATILPGLDQRQQKAYEFLGTFSSEPDPTTAAINYLFALQAAQMQIQGQPQQMQQMPQMQMQFAPPMDENSRKRSRTDDASGGRHHVPGKAPVVGENGNWKCPSCNNVNFGHRDKCNRCQAPKPEGLDAPEAAYGSMGMQFAMPMMDPSMMMMGGGQAPAPQRKGPPVAGVDGNWKCEECGNVNYAHRTECNRCKAPKPE